MLCLLVLLHLLFRTTVHAPLVTIGLPALPRDAQPRCTDRQTMRHSVPVYRQPSESSVLSFRPERPGFLLRALSCAPGREVEESWRDDDMAQVIGIASDPQLILAPAHAHPPGSTSTPIRRNPSLNCSTD